MKHCMTMRGVLRSCASAALLGALSFPTAAFAETAHVHPTNAAVPVPAEETTVPGIGAQPTAPAPVGTTGAAATPAVTPAAANPAPATAREPDRTAAPVPVENQPAETPAPAAASTEAASSAPIPTASGGGADGIDVAPPGPAANVSGGGELPFTGAFETIMLVLLAGMFVPTGVLLYCWARRSDRLRHLAAPRFQWREW